MTAPPQPVLGIDLGTTNSVVAIVEGGRVRVLADPQGHKLIPSVVSFHPSGDILVGDLARERRLIDARNTVYSIKRLLGRPYQSPEVARAKERFAFALAEEPNGGTVVSVRGDTYRLAEISAFVLRRLREMAAEALGVDVARAVITVPAGFSELQRSATKAAGRIAGLDVLRIINEPTAAALAYGVSGGANQRVAVFDLGGGTFDITILEIADGVLEVVATGGDTFLGGDDVDLALAEIMCDGFLRQHRLDVRTDRQSFERVRAAAEWAKCRLATEETASLRLQEIAIGLGGQPLDLEFRVTRPELDRLAQPLVTRALEVCSDVLRAANVATTQIDAVILVGGSTRMRLVQSMVRDFFGQEPLGSIDPDLVVAQGAAVHGSALAPLPVPTPAVPASRKAPPRVSLAALAEAQRARAAAEAGPAGPAFAPREPSQHYVPPVPLPAADDAGDEGETRAPLSHPPPPGVPPLLPASTPPPFAEPRVVALPPPVPIGRRAPPPLPPGASPPRAAPPAPPPPPPPPAPPEEMLVLSGGAAPLLMDVTPLSLGLETVAGYCEPVIERNAQIPVEQTRIFTTSIDGQRSVRVRVCQGESRRIAENQPLGTIELSDLPAAPRGGLQIEVTFVIDSDGTLGVRARDVQTGREQAIRVSLLGGVDADALDEMARRHEQLARGAGRV